MASIQEKQQIINKFTDSIERGNVEEAIMNLNNIIKYQIKVGAQQPQITQQHQEYFRQKQLAQFEKQTIQKKLQEKPNQGQNTEQLYLNDKPDESVYKDYPDLNRGQVQKIYQLAKDNKQTFSQIYEGGFWQQLF